MKKTALKWLASAIMATVATVLVAAAAMADVPTNMNVQGVLTDGSGAPVASGLKIFTFKIFDAEVGGTEIWPGGPGEDQTLSTDDDGLWQAAVGKVIPLPASVFDPDTGRWLEVTVNDGVSPPETLTRIKLNTNPYAYRAHSSQNADSLGGLDATAYSQTGHSHAPGDISPQGTGSGLDADMVDGLNSGDLALAGHSHANASGWTDDGTVVRLTTSADSVGIGTATPDYKLHVAGTVAASEFYALTFAEANARLNTISGAGQLELYNGLLRKSRLWGWDFGELDLFDLDGSNTISLRANYSSGGLLLLNQEDGSSGAYFGGGNTSAGALLTMRSAAGSAVIQLDAQGTGNGSVIFPPDAISDAEVLDEPGISADESFAITSLVQGGSMQDIVTTAITIPTSGYIVVHGFTTVQTTGTTLRNQAYVQIDETASGGIATGYYQQCGLGTNGASFNYFPVAPTRVFFKASPGTYTFRLEAMAHGSNGAGAATNILYGRIFATFFPTSYGAVNTVASSTEASQFEQARAIQMGSVEQGVDAAQETVYSVDLRELELKAARLEAEAQAAQVELLEARMAAHKSQATANEIDQQEQ